ncbi:hypothetical protein [Methanococcus sp. CF]
MVEIGGYFGLEQFTGTEYHDNVVALNTGRNALLYLIKAKKIQKIYIPYFLCECIPETLKCAGISYDFYNIDKNFNPIFEKNLENGEYLYIVNYYGQLNNNIFKDYKWRYKNIIVDNAQAFFKKPIVGIDMIYTCRKFFGVPDGAYLSTKSRLKDLLPQDISNNRMKHILGRYEETASEYYCEFQKNEESFNLEPIKSMSKLTHNILKAIDYNNVIKIRDNNYKYLESKLNKFNKLKLKTQEGAFAYPLYISNGSKIKQVLIKNGVYIPTIWPNVLKNMPYGSIEYDYASNILPLPCDQRYGTNEMDYIIELLLDNL